MLLITPIGALKFSRGARNPPVNILLMSRAKDTNAVLKDLRAFGLKYPGTHFKSPWPGHKDLAVKDKTFAYLSLEGEPLGISCKLPQSASVALIASPYTA